MTMGPIEWLVQCDEPWTRYRTLVDLLDRSEEDGEVHKARQDMLSHPQVADLLASAAQSPARVLKRHNDASLPIYALSTLADFGVKVADPGVSVPLEVILSHQSEEGAFQTQVNIPKAFGGTGEDAWSWMACDAPTVLYTLLTMGLDGDERARRGVDHLVSLVEDNGWRCRAAPELGKFKGPGRKGDPCPFVNLVALKALAQIPDLLDSPATRRGCEMLLWHWEHQTERKIYMFGIGTDYRKLKYPFVWYDVLHVVEVLSQYPLVRSDKRFREMVGTITVQADAEGRYTAGSMYRAWKGWSFADKKNPSPWLTFLVLRIQKRLASGG
jgi:hypothetical protein